MIITSGGGLQQNCRMGEVSFGNFLPTRSTILKTTKFSACKGVLINILSNYICILMEILERKQVTKDLKLKRYIIFGSNEY